MHCEECHTPRNFLGGLDHRPRLRRQPQGPDGQKAPNITPDPETGIGKWKPRRDHRRAPQLGKTPDGDTVDPPMADVVDGTSKLSDADRHAIAVYIESLPPLRATGK